jgi:hypothetical protein
VRASDIVRQLCSVVSHQVHRARWLLMLALVDGLVRGNRLSLTCLARSLASNAAPKHRIKRVDRFLGNFRVHDEIPIWYSALARRILRHCRRPVILLDWTQTIGDSNALVAGVAFSGRAIPIYAEVHPGSKLGNRKVQHSFLEALAAVLPAKTRPIIVADAGFKTPFFKSVRERGWDFVIRLRGNGVLRRMSRRARHRDPRLTFEAAFASAGDRARDLGDWTPYAAQGALEQSCRIVLSARPATAEGPPRLDPYGRRAVEPWLLATTLQGEPALQIVGIYRLRMQIELTFRDKKNGNLGWGLEHAKSGTEHRQAVLLLIGCIALTATMLVGAHAEAAGRAKRYQANTIRHRRVQALSKLGAFVLADGWRADPLKVILDGRSRVVRFVRTGIQLRLPYTTLHYGKWR